MISELYRLIELGTLIGKNTNGEVNVHVNVNTHTVWGVAKVEVWIFFFEKRGGIAASYNYVDSPNILNILTMMFNESRSQEKSR